MGIPNSGSERADVATWFRLLQITGTARYGTVAVALLTTFAVEPRATLATAFPDPAYYVAPIGTAPLCCSDIIAHPERAISFGPQTPGTLTITYSFDQAFLDAVPNEPGAWPDNPRTLIQNQIHLAFQQWSDAATTAYGGQDSYRHQSTPETFVDIQSVALHEIGHLLDLQHPDHATLIGRNYQLLGPSQPPWDWTPVASSETEVMTSWLNDGMYNRIITHDDLDGLRYLYERFGTALEFEWVPSGGMITVSADDLANHGYGDDVWAIASGPAATASWRGANEDADAGLRSYDGLIIFNTASVPKLGIRFKSINWDFETKAPAIAFDEFEVRASGTAGPSILVWSEAPGTPKWTSHSETSAGDDFKDERIHLWSQPDGGVVNAGTTVHVGFLQDVYDIGLVYAEAIHTDGFTRTDAPLLNVDTYANWVLLAARDPHRLAEGLALSRKGTVVQSCRGIRIVNPFDYAITVSEVEVGAVSSLGLTLADLHDGTRAALVGNGTLEALPVAQSLAVSTASSPGAIVLPAGGELQYAFATDATCPPPPSGALFQLDRPQYLDTELFVHARGETPAADANVYAVLGQGVAFGTAVGPPPPVPSTSTPWLALIAVACLLVASALLRRTSRTRA